MKSASKKSSLFSDKNVILLDMLRGYSKNSNNIFYEHDLEGYFTFIGPQIKDLLDYSLEELQVKWHTSGIVLKEFMNNFSNTLNAQSLSYHREKKKLFSLILKENQQKKLEPYLFIGIKKVE